MFSYNNLLLCGMKDKNGLLSKTFKKFPKSPFRLASHAGVFRGARISLYIGSDEIQAPLKSPAWEATASCIGFVLTDKNSVKLFLLAQTVEK